MLCPEVWDFPAPKVKSCIKKNQDFPNVIKAVELNNFYKSIIITCPDEINIPQDIEESLLDDSNYYKIYNCPLSEFLEPTFIKSFVKKGKIYCLSNDTNCMTDTCIALTPDGLLTLHLLRFLYQRLGLEGKKCLHDFYQVQINLKDLKNLDRIKRACDILKSFNFNIYWQPDNEEVCPSSIAKYFCDRNLKVTCESLTVERIKPDIRSIPSLINSEIGEIVEWIGMLIHGADITPSESYVSSYCEPECDDPIDTTRISILIIKGFLTPNMLIKTSQLLSDHARSREINNYWMCISLQTIEDSLWQWTPSVPKVFQPHNSSTNIFFHNEISTIYSIAELKFT